MVVALASCTPSQDTLDRQRIYDAEQLVRQQLRDPSSAEFSGSRLSSAAGFPVVCGMVNSRNGFGGMAGTQRFISGNRVILEEQEPGVFVLDWGHYCVDHEQVRDVPYPIAQTAPCRASSQASADVVLTVHRGEQVMISDFTDGWLKVRRGAEAECWVRGSVVGHAAPPTR